MNITLSWFFSYITAPVILRLSLLLYKKIRSHLSKTQRP